MKEIINLTDMYWLIENDNEYMDTNGCRYKSLTNTQKHILNKTYFFVMQKETKSITLHAYQISTDEDESSITFKQNEVVCVTYKDKMIHEDKNEKEIMAVYKNSINPEIFISFVTYIMAGKPCYEKFMSWVEFTILDIREGINERLYVMLFHLMRKNQDGIISELLSKNMMAILYDFIFFSNKRELQMEESRNLLRLAQDLEDLTFPYLKLNRMRGDVCETLYEVMQAYGKENTQLITKFIKTLKCMGEQSIRSMNFKHILEILKELSTIKRRMPELDFYTSVNYILKRIFTYYEDRPDPEGFLNLLKMWHDYLVMKEDEDTNYPAMLKEAHDKASENYNKNNKDISLNMYRDFKDAVEEYKDLEYEGNEYKIRTPYDPKEMFEVGSNLHICVGFYMKIVAAKKSKVLWLCNKENVPIAALEVRADQLVQAKQERNRYPDPEMEKFIKLWCTKKDLSIVSF